MASVQALNFATVSGAASEQIKEPASFKRAMKDIINFELSDREQKALNYAANGGASIMNLFAFINGNWNIVNIAQEKLDYASELWARIAVAVQGALLSQGTLRIRNFIPSLGNILEIPIALFSSWDDLWFTRGISQGLSQFQPLIKNRPETINSKIVFDEKGVPKLKYKNLDFGDGNKGFFEGFFESVVVTLREIPSIVSELIKNPTNITSMCHSMLVASCGQVAGTIIGMTGNRRVGAVIRDIFGTLVDYSLILHKGIGSKSIKAEKEQKTNNDGLSNQRKVPLDFNSKYVSAGLTWIIAAVVDIYKRFPSLAKNASCLTSLSLSSDRAASMLYANAYMDENRKSKEKVQI